jgi:hypothetical protein
MKKLLLAGIAGPCSISLAHAAPVTDGTVISVGNLTFSNFSCTDGGRGDASGSCAGLSVNSFASTGIEFAGGLSAVSTTATPPRTW